MALSNGGSSFSVGTGSIEIRGALGTSVSFYAGQTGGGGDFVIPAGFTGYTYTRSLDEVTPLPFSGEQPEDVIKHFATAHGGSAGPFGPLDGPVLGEGTGAGYFNSFRFTNGTFAGDVFANSRSGEIQLENVTVTYEPALDILRNSVTAVGLDATLEAHFLPHGSKGDVPLTDLAEALGVDHFNWRQKILGFPGTWKVAKFINVTTASQLSDVFNGGVSGTNDRPVYSDGTSVDMVPLTTPILDPTTSASEYYAFFIDGTWRVVTVGHGVDAFEYYFDERSSNAGFWGNFLIDPGNNPSFASLRFEDTPSLGFGGFTGGMPYLKFQTELVGVKSDGSAVSWRGLGTNFVWKSNAVNAENVYNFAQPFRGDGPAIVSGGVFDVFSDDSDTPNAPPVAVDDSAAVGEGGSTTIVVLANDDNPDFGSVESTSVVVTSQPLSGTVIIEQATGIATYTPHAGFVGSDSFRYTVRDDKGAVSNEGIVTITVLQAPLAADDVASTREANPVGITVLSNDSDPDGSIDPTSVAIVTGPSHGSISVDPATGVITYAPTVGFSGPDTFRYTVKDADGVVSNEATVTVTVIPNLPPVAANDMATTKVGRSLVIPILNNDSDPDGIIDPTSVAITAPPANAAATVNQRRNVLATNDDSSPVGSGSASAISGTVNAFGRIDLGVSGYSDFGFTGAHSQSGDYSLYVRLGVSNFSGFNPATFDFQFNDSVTPGQADFFSRSGLTPGAPFIAWIDNLVGAGFPDTVLGTLSVTTEVTYTSNPGFVGTDTFGYTVKDNEGKPSGEAIVTVTIVANVGPTAIADSATTILNVPVTLNVVNNDFDSDGSIDPLSVNVVTQPFNGAVTVDASTGEITYTPVAGFIGTDNFAYVVRDDDGDASDSTAVAVTVNPNVAPLAVNDQAAAVAGLPVSLNVLANDTDTVGNIVPGSVALTSLPMNGIAAVDPTTGRINYTANDGFVGTDTFRYTVMDNSGAISNEATVSITVSIPATIVPHQVSTPASALVDALLADSSGLTIVGVSFVGANGQAGTYSGLHLDDGNNAVSVADGVILTSGLAVGALGPNDDTGFSASIGLPGHSGLNQLVAPAATFDANVLTIQFTADADISSIQFDFLFGSEEFPEFVGAFNDPLGVFLDGVQISFDSNGNPVTVNNNFFLFDNSNDPFDSDTFGKTAVDFHLQYDGMTPRLTTQAELDANVAIHTLVFAIADAGDDALDSGVFLSGLRGSAAEGGGTGQAPTAEAGGPYTVLPNATVQLDGSGSSDSDQESATLSFEWDLDGDGIFGETGAAAARGAETGIMPVFSAAGLSPSSLVNVELRVIDASGLASTDSATVEVLNLPPVNAAPTIDDASVNSTIGDTASHTFMGSDPDGDALTWSFVDLCGPGGATPAIAPTFNPVTQSFSWNTSGSPLGVWVAQVQATDPSGFSDIGSLTITVAQPSLLNVDVRAAQGSINIANQGVIPFFVLTTADFDATTVDVSTVRLGGAAPVQRALEDVDADGDLDLVLHFRTQEADLRSIYRDAVLADLADGSFSGRRQRVDLTITGETLGGTAFEGTTQADVFLAGKAFEQFLESL